MAVLGKKIWTMTNPNSSTPGEDKQGNHAAIIPL